MNEKDILNALTEVFRDVFDDDDIVLTPDTTANDIDGWDSQTHVLLIVAAEQRFGVKFRTAELESLKNVGHFAELIRAKLDRG
ncbi:MULTISPECIES: acyl carrier protein [Stutzerimonas]|jgi:acyl carrier protein|uniref:Acyl carrier protein n=2 Tax=Stutzerimonas balearica TaxID=74829 RepID=A0A8D3Y182_9GAMM|nr:acyl carrier protein [Stutzerimonas balearica]KIL05523.1 acyl carrier protein [Stutzerimonas stutzeri]WIX04728.1 acyl carrier protein [Pseudomonas sp. AR5]HAV88429.1 acyl carrier protein [Pseudomonas sp.]AJE15364.1 acyl carrier protein [Stutzerimonas balearica DSM 6083]MBC7199587.1 acyl carrier protein [Stutzerimonas balearica]